MHAQTNDAAATPQQSQQVGWRRYNIGLLAGVATLALVLATPHPVQAKVFQCRAADVQCLIAAITTANTNGQKKNEIRLEAGTYTVTAVHNTTHGPNGLPSVTSRLTIGGAGPAITSVECTPNTSFRILHVAATATLTLEGLTLSGCDSGGSPGGGFYNDGGTVHLIHSIVANKANVSSGGGFYNHAGTVTVTDSTLTSRAQFGGGFYNEAGTVTLRQTTIAHGLATAGGGFYNKTGTVTLRQTTITDNGSIGGGGFFNDAGIVTLTDGTITDNGGETGGGFWNQDGTVILTNCTITGNQAVLGGAAGFTNGSGTVTLTNCTIVDNTSRPDSSSTGGFGNSSGTVTLVNTILAHNFGAAGTSNCRGQAISLGHNLLGDTTGCTLTPLDSDVIAPSDSMDDLGLGALINNGTPGHGHLPLLPTSPAIDMGNDAACPDTDQLGEERVGPCDIGAVEFQNITVSRR